MQSTGLNLKYLRKVKKLAKDDLNADITDNLESNFCLTWAPNSRKLATSSKDRLVYLYDENGECKDRFPTKPKDSSKPEYYVTCLAFSPDSSKIAVGQSDGALFLYKIGHEFKSKKTISSKVFHSEPVFKVLWPNEQEIICGLIDGKLKYSSLVNSKGIRTKTFHSQNSQLLALVLNSKRNEFAASFVDEKVAVFAILENETIPLLYVFENQSPVCAIAYGGHMLLVGSSDCKIRVLDQGREKQVLDFSHDPSDRDFFCGTGSPSGLGVVFSGFNRLRLLLWAPRKKMWEEGPVLDMKNAYSITSVVWNEEGTKVAAGTMLGSLHLLETVMKKSQSETYEISYSSPSDAVVTIYDPPMTAVVKSVYKLELLEIRILAQDKYAVALTLETMIICDISRDLCSEIRWDDIDENEKFYFENPNACMIFNNGEMFIVEYGQNKILGTFRTEFINPFLISLRINERMQVNDGDVIESKKLAYLADLKTITIVDLLYSSTLGYINHDSYIDWLELNESGKKLMYRDRNLKLTLVDILTMEKHTLVNHCNFVQWVALSDVIVAQSKKKLLVWYNANFPSDITELESNGVAFDIVRNSYDTIVLLQDGGITHEVYLDSTRIEFETCVLDGDLLRGLLYLELGEYKTDKTDMWRMLGQEAVSSKNLFIAYRAACASGDYCRASFIQSIMEEIETIYKAATVDSEDLFSFVEAKFSLLKGNLLEAESHLIESQNPKTALSLYINNNQWRESMRLAKEKRIKIRRSLLREEFLYYITTGQDDSLADLFLNYKNFELAAYVLWSAGMPSRASKLIKNYFYKLSPDENLLEGIGQALVEKSMFTEAASFYEVIGKPVEACENYAKCNDYEQAVRISRTKFPSEVLSLQELWGNYLAQRQAYNEASEHYIEAGLLKNALDAAINGKDWEKSAQILDSISDPRTVAIQHLKLGEHFLSIDDEVQAEKYFIRGGAHKKAVDMYLSKQKWQEAYSVASTVPPLRKETEEILMKRAEAFYKSSNLSQAEKIYVALNQPDSAITMYNESRLYEDMFRLIEIYHAPHLKESYIHVASTLRNENNLKAAEVYYCKASQFSEAYEMYLERNLFEDAARVSKSEGNFNNFKRAIFKWAETLNVDTGYKLLIRYDLLDQGIAHYCNEKNFELAKNIAKQSSDAKYREVLILSSKMFEDEDEWENAFNCYLEAEEPLAGIQMLLHHELYEMAIDKANAHASKEDLQNTLLIYAKYLFNQELYPQFDAVILKANKPEEAVRLYKENGLWSDAFRFSKEYCPKELAALKVAYDKANDFSGLDQLSATQIMRKGQEFEKFRQFEKAIELYLKLDGSHMDDVETLFQYWAHAVRLSAKYLTPEESEEVLSKACPKMIEIRKGREAAELCIEGGYMKMALEIFIELEMFDRAVGLANELGPQMIEYVKMRMKKMKSERRRSSGSQMMVDKRAALDILVEKGKWDELLEEAKHDKAFLEYYLGRYVYDNLKNLNIIPCLKMYSKYSVPPTQFHYTHFRNLIRSYLSDPELDSFDTNSLLRDTLFLYLEDLENSIGDTDIERPDEAKRELQSCLLPVHLYANRSLFRNVEGFELITGKLSVILLRFTNLFPVERVFYDAGLACKDLGWNELGKIFFTRYLDIFDLVEDGKSTTESLDHSELEGTVIPRKSFVLPKHLVSEEEHEEAREWILTTIMDAKEQKRNKNSKMGESGYEADGRLALSKMAYVEYKPCIITGYPVVENGIRFSSEERGANREDWNFFMSHLKATRDREFQNVHDFVMNWCGAQIKYTI